MQGIRYYDLRQVRGYSTRIDIDNGVVEEAGTSFFNDTVIRALGQKGWGVVTMDSFDSDSPGTIQKVINEATLLTAVTHENILLSGIPGRPRPVPLLKEDPAVMDLDEKIDLLQRIERAARIPEIVNTRATYLERQETVRFMDSSGVDLSYMVTRCGFSVMAVALRQNLMQMGRESKHTITGFNLRHQESLGEKAGRTAVALLDAVPARGGTMNVILDQELGGVFAHEAVGHASEGDLIKEGSSVLKGKLGQRIGNRSLTIIDDPSIPEFGFEPLDAEGIAVHRTEIIQRGEVHAFLHNRETAPVVGNGEPGNARAMAGSIPQVRMSNTFIENGDASFEELLEGCGRGILLKGSRGGQVDPGRGVFLFNAEYGYLVANGECTTMVRDVSLSGEILRTLHDIDLIGNDRFMYEGFCGKGGQSVPVSDGAPHLLLRNAVVGGSGTD